MFDPADARDRLRRRKAAQRKQQSAADRTGRCRAIQQYVECWLHGHPEMQKILSYFPIQNEAAPLSDEQEEKLLGEGRRLFLPRVENAQNGTMCAVPYFGKGQTPGSDSRWGIFEPDGTAVDPEILDCVLVPGVAFDGRGFRLGYGKGFYDRFLPQLRPGVPMIGIGYDFQMVPSVFPQPQDVRLSGMITEQGIRWFSSTQDGKKE